VDRATYRRASGLGFGVLAGLVLLADAPRDLVLPIWIGAMLALAGTGYWTKQRRSSQE
jgi:hypothetical protein